MIASIATAPVTAVVARRSAGPNRTTRGPTAIRAGRAAFATGHRETLAPPSPRRAMRRSARGGAVRAQSISEPPSKTTERAPADAPAAGDRFDWARAWYPMSPIDFLDETAPNPMKVLGKSIVAWKGEGGAWAVVEDSCPHRMAPLSLGFISEDKQLVCRYHGWEFGNDGKATAIPMSTDAKAEKTACESPRSCAVSYPVKEEAGVLWVWPTAGADAWLEASATPVATAAAEFGELPGEWGMVELPVGYAPALENQFDPSHAEWLHAKYNAESGLLDGAMNVAYEPMTRFNVKEGTMSAGGFTVEHGGYNAGNKDVSAERLFTAPCSSRSEYKDANGKRYLSAAILYTPTEPGRCLMFTKFQAHTRKAVQGAGKAKVTAGDRWRGILESPAKTAFQWYMEFVAKDPELCRIGLQHGVYGSGAYTLGDQDIQAMHGVEVAMESAERDWKKSYYLPTPSDAGVAGFRTWMDEHAGGGVKWADGVRDDESKMKPIAQRLERYERHTRHCRYCKAALRELGVLEERLVDFSNAMLAAGLVFGLGGAVVGQEGPAVVSLCLAGLAVNATESVRDMQHGMKTSVPRRGDPIPKLW